MNSIYKRTINSCMGLPCHAIVGEPTDEEALIAFLSAAKQHGANVAPLGVTSNVLLPSETDSWLCFYQADNIESHINNYTVILRIGAGKDWPTLVKECADQGWWGIENLAEIPGKVGAAPIQNIGAYGCELADVFVSCEAINTRTLEKAEFSHAACKFGYRDSIFKHTTDSWFITSVTLKLSVQGQPNLAYGPLTKVLTTSSTPSEIVEQISALRWSKLPNPQDVPNTGSFFHNPIVSHSKYKQLKSAFPEIVAYPVNENQFKLAAGWLIDNAGLKGKAGEGGVCMFNKQGLVLTNPNRASRELVLGHARYVQEVVFDRYGVSLNIEPIIL